MELERKAGLFFKAYGSEEDEQKAAAASAAAAAAKAVEAAMAVASLNKPSYSLD